MTSSNVNRILTKLDYYRNMEVDPPLDLWAEAMANGIDPNSDSVYRSYDSDLIRLTSNEDFDEDECSSSGSKYNTDYDDERTALDI